MDFIDEVKQFADKVQSIKDQLLTEEATKHAVILPFLQMLGYNVFDPTEVVPEFTADVGIKKGERVDYAIMNGGKPAILIEVKPIDDPLTTHDNQLYRYFTVTESKFAILTNGVLYKFFSDIQEPNKMDDTPFLVFNLFDIKEGHVPELKKFKKESFNVDELSTAAATLKYTNKVKEMFDGEIKEPSEDLIRFFLREIYSGKATQNVIERFRPIIKRALGQYMNELINDKLKAAIDATTNTPEQTEEIQPEPPQQEEKQLVTTVQELEAYFIVKFICKELVEQKRLTYKDTMSYFTVLYDGNTRKWVCRFFLEGNQKMMILPKEDKSELKIVLKDVDDIYKHRDKILEVVKRYVA